MAGADTQNLSGLYKTKFQNYVAEMTNRKYPLTDLFKFERAEFAGRRRGPTTRT